MRNKEASDFFGITVQTRITSHNFGAIDAPDVEMASASLQHATSCEITRNADDSSIAGHVHATRQDAVAAPLGAWGRLVAVGGSLLQVC